MYRGRVFLAKTLFDGRRLEIPMTRTDKCVSGEEGYSTIFSVSEVATSSLKNLYRRILESTAGATERYALFRGAAKFLIEQELALREQAEEKENVTQSI